MKLLLAFAPFLAFALLEHRIGPHGALVVAAAVSAILVIRDRFILHSTPKILEIGSLILFGALAIATRFPEFVVSVLSVRLWVDLGLLFIVVGSIIVGRPFTLQYALEKASPEAASRPEFRRTSVQIAIAWGIAFTVIVIADLAMMYIPAFTPVVGTVVILSALGISAWYTAWKPHSIVRNEG